jgi:hypothetical protein
MSNLSGLVFLAMAVVATIAVGASALGIGACLVGMKSREAKVRRRVASLIAAVLSLPLAAAGAVGGHYLASFRGIGFAAEFGVYYAVGVAAAAAAVVGFTVGRFLSRPRRIVD